MLLKSIFILILFFAAVVEAQDYNVKINLKDGNIIEGKLLKISAQGVDINPGGNVKYRFVSAERIKNVEIVELQKTIEYPLANDDMPEEIMGNEIDYGSGQQAGFPRFLGIGSGGYSSVGGDYYLGFNSGFNFHLGMYYLFHDSNPTASRYFIGFTYSHSSVTGDKIYTYDPKLLLNEYSFEFGTTTGLFNGGHYLYGLLGLVIVSNEVSMEIESQNGVTSTLNVNETKAAIRIEGDGSISLGSKISILISLGYDIVLGPKEYKTYYNPNEPNFSIAGGILNLSIGLSYGFL